MGHWLAIAASALLSVSAAQAASTPRAKVVSIRPAVIMVDLDATGKASNVRCDPTVVADICAVIAKAAPTWQYAVGSKDGVAIPMTVTISLHLRAKEIDDAFELNVTAAELVQAADLNSKAKPFALKTTLTPPRYPAEQMRRGVVGNVMLEVWFEPGSELVTPGKTWFNGKPDAHHPLVMAAIEAAKKWADNPGPGVVRSRCVPVGFSTSLNGSGPVDDQSVCQPTYLDGYTMPKLLTTAESMVL
jgi:hypothetical protein